MAISRRYLGAFVLLVLSCASLRANAESSWDPRRTWVFVASVMSWKDPALASFTRPRLDADLVAAVIAAGVPAEQVVFLKDQGVTRSAVRAGLAQLAVQAGAGSTFIFYFQGHGLRHRGATVLATYDIDTQTPAQTGLPVDDVAAILERSWKGERLLLFGDSCHSGALGAVARRLATRPGVKAAAITSATASNRSTSFWTFTEALIAAFRGEPILDRDRSGTITFDEVDRFVHDEMKYAEGQLTRAVRSDGFEPGFALRPVSRPAALAKAAGPWQVGDYVQAQDREGGWYGARVVEVKPESWYIHYPGWEPRWDEWVPAGRIRPIRSAALAVGRRYEVEWEKGHWYPASVVRCVEDYFCFVHYSGELGDSDEWVTAARVRTGRAVDFEPGVVPAVAQPVVVGARLAARWNKDWYLATVTERTQDGLWRVRYADNTDGLVLSDELLPLGAAAETASGDRVLASWKGSARLYLGTVLDTEDRAVRIKWDDGSAPSLVPLDRVARIREVRP